ncbi:MAG: hypothetical protein KatS3mg057_3143 [Herpetosiphonaceae bacterium]|nr:MAG: hypothetical protein KatS3mg057_3143 [Herpetosiphonaceae bacterium]
MRPPVGDIAKVDYAINAALLLSYVAMLKGDHIGLLTFADHVGSYLPPRRGKGQFQPDAGAAVQRADPSRSGRTMPVRLSYLSIKKQTAIRWSFS